MTRQTPLAVILLVAALPVLSLGCLPSEEGIARVVDERVATALARVPTETVSPTVTPRPTVTPIRLPPAVATITLPPSSTLQPAATAQPTATPQPTHTPLPMQAPLPTVVPLPTLVPLPTYTLVPTHTPLPTQAPLPTLAPDPTYTPYPTYTRLPTLRPLPTYTPLPPPTSTRIPVPMTIFGDGIYRVGTDILPGTYRTTDSQRCLWKRLRGFSGESRDLIDQIETDFVNDPVIVVTIPAADVGFESSGCGDWHRISR